MMSEVQSTSQALPKDYLALFQEEPAAPLTLRRLPVPEAVSGSVIIRVLAAPILTYAREIYNGERKYYYPTPYVPGASAVGRVVAVGPDATKLSAGDLVLVDATIRGRDDPEAIFLSGIHGGYSEGARKLSQGMWRNSTFAEYARMPMETCTRLNESRLLGSPQDGGLGLEVADLAFIQTAMIPFGGLRDINLRAGERIIICPATGNFGGAAVMVALAMGASVIAMGRNTEVLAKLKELGKGRVDTIQMSGNAEDDEKALRSYGGVDAYFDISPPQAASSSHFRSCILALKPRGRVSLMGGMMREQGLPCSVVVHNQIALRGKWMAEAQDIAPFLQLVEAHMLTLGEKGGVTVRGKFGLKDWQEAFDSAAANARPGDLTVFTP